MSSTSSTSKEEANELKAMQLEIEQLANADSQKDDRRGVKPPRLSQQLRYDLQRLENHMDAKEAKELKELRNAIDAMKRRKSQRKSMKQQIKKKYAERTLSSHSSSSSTSLRQSSRDRAQSQVADLPIFASRTNNIPKIRNTTMINSSSLRNQVQRSQTMRASAPVRSQYRAPKQIKDSQRSYDKTGEKQTSLRLENRMQSATERVSIK